MDARRGPQAELLRAIEELLADDLPAWPPNTLRIPPPRRPEPPRDGPRP